MLSLLFIAAAVVGITILPVKFTANMVGAERTGFGTVTIAVILQMIFTAVARSTVSINIISVLVLLICGSAIYAYILGTTMLKGFAINIISSVIALIVAFMFGASLALILSPAT